MPPSVCWPRSSRVREAFKRRGAPKSSAPRMKRNPADVRVTILGYWGQRTLKIPTNFAASVLMVLLSALPSDLFPGLQSHIFYWTSEMLRKIVCFFLIFYPHCFLPEAAPWP